MAKNDEPGVLSQHMEKIVLLVSMVLLSLAMVRYVFSSPREVEVVGAAGRVEAVSLEKIPGTLEKALDYVERRNSNATVPEENTIAPS